MIRANGFIPAAALPLVLLLLGATRDFKEREDFAHGRAGDLIHRENTRAMPRGRPHVVRITKGNSIQTRVLNSKADRTAFIQERCGIQLMVNTAHTARHIDLHCREDGRVFFRILPPELVLAFGIPPEISRTSPAFWTHVSGIGTILADRIHESLHDPELGICENGRCQLEKIRGIGPRLAARIREFLGYSVR